jgi:hypothetical protein
MAGNSQVRGQFNEKLFTSNLNKVFGLGYKDYPAKYTEVFNTENTDRWFVENISMVGIGPMAQKNELGPIAPQNIMSGWLVRYDMLRYATALSFSYELIKDMRYGQIAKATKLFGKSAMITRELLASNYLNTGFTTNWHATDAVPFFSTAHKLQDGSATTVANTFTVQADLSLTSLQQAMDGIANWVDNKGNKTVYTPQNLWFGVGQRWAAEEYLKSPDRPDTANRAINVMQGTVTPKLWHYIDDQDAWFIQCSEHSLMWYDRDPLETGSEMVPMSAGDMFYYATFRCDCGADDWRGWWGSTGAG